MKLYCMLYSLLSDQYRFTEPIVCSAHSYIPSIRLPKGGRDHDSAFPNIPGSGSHTEASHHRSRCQRRAKQQTDTDFVLDRNLTLVEVMVLVRFHLLDQMLYW